MVTGDEGQAEAPVETVGWGRFGLLGQRKRRRAAEKQRIDEVKGHAPQ